MSPTVDYATNGTGNESFPEIRMLKHEPDPQLSSVNIKAHLVSTELFKNLEDAVLDEMATQVEIIRVPGGEPLFQQGDPGDSLYIVINGRLRVTVNREREYEEVVAEVGRDEMIGEMSLLTGEIVQLQSVPFVIPHYFAFQMRDVSISRKNTHLSSYIWLEPWPDVFQP